MPKNLICTPRLPRTPPLSPHQRLAGSLLEDVQRTNLRQEVRTINEGDLTVLPGVETLTLLQAVNKHFVTPTVLVCVSDKAHVLLIYSGLMEKLIAVDRFVCEGILIGRGPPYSNPIQSILNQSNPL